MQSSIAEHEESVSRLQVQHMRSHKEVEALNSQIEGLFLEVKRKEVEIAALKERVQHEGKEDLQARLKGSESDVQLGEKEKTSAGDVIEQLRAELLKQRTENEELSKELLQFRGGGDDQLVEIWQGHGDSSPVVNKTGVEYSTENLELKLRTESQKCERLQMHLAQMSEEHDVELSQLLSERESLEEKVTTLQEELDSTLLTQNDAVIKSNQLSLENSQLSGEISQLREATSRLEMELEDLRCSQNDHKSATATETSTHHETSQFEDVDLDSYQQLPVGSEVDSQFVERLQTLEAEIEKKDSIVTMLEASAANSEALRKSLEGSLAQMGREKEELEKEVLSMVAENQQLRSDLQELKDEQDKTQEKSLQELQLLAQQREEQLLQLGVELDRLKSEGAEKEKIVLQLQREQEESFQTIKSHEQTLQEMSDVLSQRESEISELRKQCKEGKAVEEMLTSKCSELESHSEEEKTALLERLASLEQEVKQVHSEHQAATGMAGESQSSLREVQSSLERRSRELSQVVSSRDSLKASLIAREEEIGRLSDELSRTKEELNHEVGSLRTDNEKLLQELSVLRPEVSTVKSAKNQLQMRVEVLEGECNALQREMEEKLGAKQAECVKYTRELSRLKKHLVEVCVYLKSSE